MSFFMRLWEVIVGIAGKIWDVLLPAIEDMAKKEGQMALDLAMAYVGQVAQDTSLVTNDEKRQALFDKIQGELIAKGIDVAKEHFATTIYNAIQFAYTKYIAQK